MISSFHGIGAYTGQRNPVALRRSLSKAMNGVELCCADRPIGAFGAVFCGELTALFSRDVWSDIDIEGYRYTENGQHLILDGGCDQSEYEHLCQTAADPYYHGGYCEGWMRPVALRALWVKNWAPEKTKKAALILAKNRKVPLLSVTGKTRIWDLLDSHNLPFTWSAAL